MQFLAIQVWLQVSDFDALRQKTAEHIILADHWLTVICPASQSTVLILPESNSHYIHWTSHFTQLIFELQCHLKQRNKAVSLVSDTGISCPQSQQLQSTQ